MTFWLISVALAALVSAPLLWVLLARKGDARTAADFDIAVYRDQLREVERDLERGTIAEDVAERTRLEISRRILEADKARQSAAQTRSPKAVTWAAGLFSAIVLIGGSLLLYRDLGAPGYGDLPLKQRIAMADELRQNRPDQATAEAQVPPAPSIDVPQQYLDLVAELRAKLEDRPDDARGLELLAANEANLGNFKAAYNAQAHLLDVIGESAPADAHASLAEYYIMAAGGYVSPEAERALRAALQRDPRNGPARYYSGLMFVQTGRPDLGFRTWRPLLEQSPPDAPWVPAIRAQIEEAAARAGIRYSLPPAAPAMPPATGLAGPSADDMAAASEMSEDDRAAMIEGMVDRLGERLATQGGSSAEWAQLIGALGVMGQADRAQAIYDEAKQVFSADPEALEGLRQAAEGAGLAL